jgi:tetratricopeptide (TPR) repeat protein
MLIAYDYLSSLGEEAAAKPYATVATQLAVQKENLAMAHIFLGLVAISVGDDPAGINSCTAALAAQPDNAEAHALIAYVYLRKNKLPLALEHCRQAQALGHKTMGFLVFVEDIFFALNLFREARTCFKKALACWDGLSILEMMDAKLKVESCESLFKAPKKVSR